MNAAVQDSSALKKERHKKLIETIDHLPSLPSIVTKLIQVVNSSDSSADDAASLIEKDPALTSKMIRLANSAFYGIPRTISSVSSAVVILGFNTIRSLVLSASVMKLFEGNGSFSKDHFWKHSIVCAMGAKTIVRHFMSVRMMDPESAFCAGILHDIGKLIFDQCIPEDYAKICEISRTRNVPLCEVEDVILGTNHAKIGKILADKWALPLDLEYGLVFHHSPQAADKINELVAAVHLADRMSHDLGYGLWEGETGMGEWSGCREFLSISEKDYEKINATLTDSVEKALDFLSIIS